MEISTTVKERGTVIMAILALLSIGITVLASTLQTFEAQEASEQRHLNMASQSILLALESAIYSGSNDIRRDYLNRRTNVLFDTLKKSEDIVEFSQTMYTLQNLLKFVWVKVKGPQLAGMLP